MANEQQAIPPVMERATPEMYEAPVSAIPQPKATKKSSPILVVLILLVVSALLLMIVFFVLTQRKYAGVVDPSSLKSACVGGTRLSWWLPDTPQTAPTNYTEIIANYNKARGEGKGVIIDTVVRKYDKYDYYTNLLNAMAKNAGPDIFALRNDDLPAYKEYMVPFATVDARAVETYKKNFVDLVGQETVLNDKLYGVTTYVDNLQLYYNKDLLDQNSVPKPATSWEEIKRQSRTLSKAKERGFNLSTIALGIGPVGSKESNITENQDIVPMIISQYGGTIYDTKTNSIGFSIPDDGARNAFSDAIKFYLDFSDNTSEQYSWDEFMGNNVDEFLQNRLVYIIGYKELDKTLKERRPDLDYQVTSLPQVSDTSKRTFGKYFVNVMSRNLGLETAKSTEIGVKRACAEDFLTYLSGVEAQKSYINQTQMPSAHRAILQDQLSVSGDQKTRIFAEGSLLAVNYYKPDVIASERIWGDLVTAARSKKDINTALAEAVGKYNTLVSAGVVLRQK
jgi:ABC-type glycerol-3-phosphate transport system substrate-binding protein